MKSKLILVDGLSGTGKGTPIPKIAEACEEHGYKPITVFEPTDFLRQTIKTYQRRTARNAHVLTLLFTTDRLQHTRETVAPRLAEENNAIISDRSLISTVAYQVMQGDDRARILELNNFYPSPNLSLIFVCEPETAVQRITQREQHNGDPRSLDETIDRMRTLKSAYEREARQLAHMNTRLVRADGSINSVWTQVHSHLSDTVFGMERPPALFLDKDGTLVDNHGYPEKIPADDIMHEHTLDGLRTAQESGYKLIIISSQPWVARGRLTCEQVTDIFTSVVRKYADEGIAIDGFYFCPHGRTESLADQCTCKKPNTGLVERAIQEHRLRIQGSAFIGDNQWDIQCGRDIGLTTYLVCTGEGTNYRGTILPDHTVANVNEAALKHLKSTHTS